MNRDIWLPSAENVKEIHVELTALFAAEDDPISPAGIKDEGLLESAIQRPNTGIGNISKYVSRYDKLAALTHSLIKNHAFHNGNKRIGIFTLLVA